ncbi:hypothetical protein F511_42818 [Dorcoceras hygrometricum]|uniref:Uncharacterized protein n=1 Tax=Dorcoceras hygrometricum TaxID=472368 RepID=A0A2Z7D2Y9_9LAMI|nr:hypothetical protein F511_42818 [Dorcoceras hygrometricum]
MESADELAMETSRVDSDVRNQAIAKLNQLEHDEPAETMNQLQVLKERSEPAGSCNEKLAGESYQRRRFNHNSRRIRRIVDGAGTKKFSKKLQMDISRYFLRRVSSDDEDQLEHSADALRVEIQQSQDTRLKHMLNTSWTSKRKRKRRRAEESADGLALMMSSVTSSQSADGLREQSQESADSSSIFIQFSFSQALQGNPLQFQSIIKQEKTSKRIKERKQISRKKERAEHVMENVLSYDNKKGPQEGSGLQSTDCIPLQNQGRIRIMD